MISNSHSLDYLDTYIQHFGSPKSHLICFSLGRMACDPVAETTLEFDPIAHLVRPHKLSINPTTSHDILVPSPSSIPSFAFLGSRLVLRLSTHHMSGILSPASWSGTTSCLADAEILVAQFWSVEVPVQELVALQLTCRQQVQSCATLCLPLLVFSSLAQPLQFLVVEDRTLTITSATIAMTRPRCLLQIRPECFLRFVKQDRETWPGRPGKRQLKVHRTFLSLTKGVFTMRIRRISCFPLASLLRG